MKSLRKLLYAVSADEHMEAFGMWSGGMVFAGAILGHLLWR